MLPLSLFPIGNPQLTTNDEDLFRKLIEERFSAFSVDSPSLTIYHEYTFFEALHSKLQTIGFPFFELDQMNDIRKKSLSCVDNIFVASAWAKEVIVSSGFNNVEVVNLGVDSEIFHPKAEKPNDDAYKFFTIGKIEKRKCTDILHKIFASAFDKHDDVEFHIMCDSPLPQIRQQMSVFTKMFKESTLGDKIFIHELKKTDEDLANFIRSMDCGVFMTRAEGWGLPILQSLACAKPIIVTDYSAQMEFCNESNSNLVNITEKEAAFDGIWFDGQSGAWASILEPQIDQCVGHMKRLYKDNARENKAGVETAGKFTWDNTAKRIVNIIDTNLI